MNIVDATGCLLCFFSCRLACDGNSSCSGPLKDKYSQAPIRELTTALPKDKTPNSEIQVFALKEKHAHLSSTKSFSIKDTFSSVQSLSHVRLCDPMNCSTPGLPVHHQLLEFTQTHVHRVSDAIQPSHPLSSPSPPAPNPSQHQSLRLLQSCYHGQVFIWICAFISLG